MRIDYYPIRNFSWAAIIVGAGTAIYSGVRAAKQKKEAKALAAKNDFPDEPIPQAALTNQKLAEQSYNEGLPEPVIAAAQQRISRTGNTALKAAGERGNALAVLPYIQQNENDANLNLAGEDAMARVRNKQQFMGANSDIANFQGSVWDWNKRQKYIQNAAAIRSLLGASNENWNTAIDRGIGAGAMAVDKFGGQNNDGGYYSDGSYIGE